MRIEGWEIRLNAIIEAARARPYELGVHDCLRVACQTVEALTGIDPWPQFAGYRSKREALATIGRHGSTFAEAVTAFFGAPPIDVRMARRGDICLVQTVDGEQHLGVCLGVSTALTAPGGVVETPTRLCLRAWRVG